VRIIHLTAAVFLAAALSAAQENTTQPVALTIYNQDFAVARTYLDLNLHPGMNEVTATGVTSRLEPDSVILRDPSGKQTIHIAEQNYDAAVVSQEWLLLKYEGRTIDFQAGTPQGMQIVQGKIIRAGVAQPGGWVNGQYINPQNTQPLIEVNGKMQFQLPGMPLFPVSTDGLLLKPALRWQIASETPEHLRAELAYITGGLDWEATYNVVAPDESDVTGDERADVLGWVTMHNQSGTDFPEATIKLMAGDVAKIAPNEVARAMDRLQFSASEAVMVNGAPHVTQKAFDDFHLYNLNRTVALRNGETKQVQFIDASDVGMQRSYIYDGASSQLQPYYPGFMNQNRGYGVDEDNTRVAVVEEIKNSEANHLGMPLPAGRLRLYRRDADGQLEFVGESMIKHTPTEDTVKIVTGSAFDVKGTRTQTDFHVNGNDRIMDERFEIKLTNQKKQAVKVTVVEPLYRAENWEILSHSADYTKRDSHTIEFPVEVPAKGETTVDYAVRYTW
jgi:hypothetical protein